MASLCLQRLVLLSILVNEVCAAKRGRNAQAMPEERSMTGKDVREATKLLESICPFPSESMHPAPGNLQELWPELQAWIKAVFLFTC